MPEINAARGEFLFKLGDHELVMAPSFKNISRIEASLGRSLLVPQALTVREYVAVIDGLAKKTPGRPDADEMGELLMRQGLKTAMPVVEALLSRITGGDETPADEGNGSSPARAG
jgi:hypothetical protein